MMYDYDDDDDEEAEEEEVCVVLFVVAHITKLGVVILMWAIHKYSHPRLDQQIRGPWGKTVLVGHIIPHLATH
ncbi:hypothetical protein Q5P01_007099 [Channa striata]|uniref:Uncharacterized protein n=1 Tax=Channa striata TaxID=64152 RepID=A0AA88N5V3_CHASR|nr:hypothetical protein Q5P01_007099 [Channa striata]